MRESGRHQLAKLAAILDAILMKAVLVLCLAGGALATYALFRQDVSASKGFASALQQDLPDQNPNSQKTPSLEELAKLNPDVLGWIQIDDTHIDQPVVQGEDDMEYINKDAAGEFSLAGAIFLSVQNSKDLSDPVSLIYGHNMDNGGMFGDLMNYTDRSFYDAHPSGTLRTLNAKYPMQVLGILQTDASNKEIYSVTDASAQSLLDYLQKNCLYFSKPEQPVSQIVLLSTCSDASSTARTVLALSLDPSAS